MPPHRTVTGFSSLDSLFDAAAERFARAAADAIASRGRFSVALSGGSTPRGLYERLADSPWRERVDWARCHFFWGDERLVPPGDPRSNYRLAHESLLARVPVLPANVHRVPIEAGDREAVALAYEATIRDCSGLAAGEWPRLDLILLGMGSDGHTASLFPGHATLDEAERIVVATLPGRLPPPVDRVTLTLPVLNAAREVVFLVTGADKADVLRRALDHDEALPAARVSPADGNLRWLVDSAAAGQKAG